jgi:hypothetical protein
LVFGMTPDEVTALAALAQVVLALAALVGSVAVSVFVWYGTRRIARLDYERSVREAWIAIDTAALASDETLAIADALENPNSESTPEVRRKRWFAYTYLNAVVSTYFGARHGLSRSPEARVEACRQMLRPLVLDDVVFEITQGHGYEPEFSALCREVREAQLRLGAIAKAETDPAPVSARPRRAAGRRPRRRRPAAPSPTI